MAASLAAPCSVSAAEKTTLTFWHAMGGTNGEVLQQIVDDFNASQDEIEIKAEYQGTYDDTITKLKAAMQSDSGLPDVCQMYDVGTKFMYDSGAVIPVEDKFESTGYDKSSVMEVISSYYTVDGKQYASAGPDYCYGINVHSDYDNQLASMIYVKWLTEESNFSYDQGGIPICVGDEYPEVLAAFDGVELVADNPAPEGEEDLFGEINTESEIALNNDNTHVQNIVEHALSGDMTMEEIVDEWNQAWTDAQEEYDITPAPYVYGSGVAAE